MAAATPEPDAQDLGVPADAPSVGEIFSPGPALRIVAPTPLTPSPLSPAGSSRILLAAAAAEEPDLTGIPSPHARNVPRKKAFAGLRIVIGRTPRRQRVKRGRSARSGTTPHDAPATSPTMDALDGEAWSDVESAPEPSPDVATPTGQTDTDTPQQESADAASGETETRGAPTVATIGASPSERLEPVDAIEPPDAVASLPEHAALQSDEDAPGDFEAPAEDPPVVGAAESAPPPAVMPADRLDDTLPILGPRLPAPRLDAPAPGDDEPPRSVEPTLPEEAPVLPLDFSAVVARTLSLPTTDAAAPPASFPVASRPAVPTSGPKLTAAGEPLALAVTRSAATALEVAAAARAARAQVEPRPAEPTAERPVRVTPVLPAAWLASAKLVLATTAVFGLPALLAWLAPPVAGAVLATGLGSWRWRMGSRRTPSPVMESLAWAALGLSAAAVAGGALAGRLAWLGSGDLSIPGSPVTWPTSALGPGGAAGLILLLVLALSLDGVAAALLISATGVLLPLAAASVGGLRVATLLPAGTSLVAASMAAWLRTDAPRPPRARWACATWGAGGLLVLGAVGVRLATGHALPGPLVLAIAMAPALPAAAVVAAGRWGSQAPTTRRRTAAAAATAVALGWATVTLVAVGLGLRVDQAVALAMLAPAALYVTAVLVSSRAPAASEATSADTEAAPTTTEAPALVPMARVATIIALGAFAACAAVTGNVLGPETVGVIALLAGLAACERRLGASDIAVLGAVGLSVLAACALSLVIGLPAAWLPTGLVAAAMLVVAAGGRLPGRVQRERWNAPALAVVATAGLASLALAALGHGLPGVVGAVAAGLAPALIAPRYTLARSAQPALAGAVPVAAALAWGGPTWVPPLLALESIGAWFVTRRRPHVLVSVGLLAFGAVVAVPLLAVWGAWLPAALALLGAGVVSVAEFWIGRRDAGRGTHALAAATMVAAPFAALALVASALAGPALPPVLLAGAVAIQALDLLTEDAKLSAWLRGIAIVAWASALGASLPQLTEDLRRGAMLLGAGTLAAMLLAALRRQRWPVFASGLTLAAATACVAASAGFQPNEHPAFFLVPPAAWIVAWGVFEVAEHRAANGYLCVGLVGLVGAMLLEAHQPGAMPLLRAVGGALALSIVLAGGLARRRVPIVIGGVAIVVELGFLVIDGLGLVAEYPGPGLAVVGGLVAATGALAFRVASRPGGTAALSMAWACDIARLRETWARWA